MLFKRAQAQLLARSKLSSLRLPDPFNKSPGNSCAAAGDFLSVMTKHRSAAWLELNSSRHG
jgi:hypothetical protein